MSPEPCSWPQSSRALKSVLEHLRAAPRKRWGQNFLLDRMAQQRIVQAAEVQPMDQVWEIGPGLGALTQHLWRKCRSLTLFEIDPALLEFYRSCPEFEKGCLLIAGDIAQTWRKARCPDIVIGNLPYNTASLVMGQFAREAGFRPRCMVFTVQKEMAARLGAKERSKAYSSFSVLMQSQFHLEALFDLPARLFYPCPAVVSTTIRLRPRRHGLSAVQMKKLERFTRTVFRQRRKTIANNLKGSSFASLELIHLGIGRNQRAEEISIEQFLALGREF